jgi:hypothetical protein
MPLPCSTTLSLTRRPAASVVISKARCSDSASVEHPGDFLTARDLRQALLRLRQRNRERPDPHHVYAGTDLGLWSSAGSGASWQRMSFSAGNWLRRWRGGRLRPPGGVWARAYPHRDLDEPAELIRRVTLGSGLATPRHSDVPRAVFAMERDELTPAAGARQYAEQIAADFEIVAGATHAVLDRPEWERCVGAVHRWIVRRLGVELLALYDEAWAGRDP